MFHLILGDYRITQGVTMSRMQGVSGSEGGGVASERTPHEDPRRYEELGSEEVGDWTKDIKERTFPGKIQIKIVKLIFDIPNVPKTLHHL